LRAAGLAMVFALFIPGAGQFIERHFARAAVIWGRVTLGIVGSPGCSRARAMKPMRLMRSPQELGVESKGRLSGDLATYRQGVRQTVIRKWSIMVSKYPSAMKGESKCYNTELDLWRYLWSCSVVPAPTVRQMPTAALRTRPMTTAAG